MFCVVVKAVRLGRSARFPGLRQRQRVAGLPVCKDRMDRPLLVLQLLAQSRLNPLQGHTLIPL